MLYEDIRFEYCTRRRVFAYKKKFDNNLWFSIIFGVKSWYLWEVLSDYDFDFKTKQAKPWDDAGRDIVRFDNITDLMIFINLLENKK